MLTVLTFWVLMTFDTSTKQVHSQQFVSEAGCKEALEFVEKSRGTYIMGKCIRDAVHGGRAKAPAQLEIRP